jgi:mannitol/fructose-specific phosphotransferase system IIA component (Ntr-type)
MNALPLLSLSSTMGIPLAERYAHRRASFGQNSFLRELARRAAASLNLAPERIVAEILKREELGSTGTGGGVAIPHARIQELATVARKLRDPTSLRDLRAAASTARLYAAMIA